MVGLLGEFGSEVPAFDTSIKDLAGDLVDLVPTIIGDILSGALDFAIGGMVDVGCWPWRGRLGQPLWRITDRRRLRSAQHADHLRPCFLDEPLVSRGVVAVSLIPFVDIAASVRDLIGAIVKGDVVGAVLELVFGAIGFVAPAIGDLPGIIGKIGKFLVRADQAIQAVFGYIVKRFGDAGSAIVRPLLKEFSGLSDEAIEQLGGVGVIIEMAGRNTNLKKIAKFLDNGGNIRRFLPIRGTSPTASTISGTPSPATTSSRLRLRQLAPKRRSKYSSGGATRFCTRLQPAPEGQPPAVKHANNGPTSSPSDRTARR